MRLLSISFLATLLGVSPVLTSLADGQYIPVRITGEGLPSPDTGDPVTSLAGQHNVTSTGQVAVELDDAGPTATDDFFWVDGIARHRAGTTVTGGGSPSDLVDNFDTYSHLTDSLDLVWVGDDIGGDFLALNGVGLSFEGDPAPGVPGRVFNDYNEPCLTASLDIFFRADLDGSTLDDEVIYFLPSGGVPIPLELGIGTGVFREGQLIIGGPLDGNSWDDAVAFVALEGSASGVLLIEGDVEPGTEVLVRKQPGMIYELLVSEGDTFLTPVGGLLAPIENINQISQARGNLNWAIDAKFDDVVTGTASDDVVLADVGGGVEVIAQEGQDIAALTGFPGTTLGFLSQVSVNTNGKVVYLADIQDDGVNIPPYSEAIFQWDAGATTLVITDEIPVPGSPDLLTNLELDLVINDQDRIFFQGDLGTADQVFEALLPTVFPVESLTCMPSATGTQVTASWAIPAGQSYDGIRIFVEGALEATLSGGALTYTTAPFSQSSSAVVEVEPFVGTDDAPRLACTTPIVLPPDFVECSTPMPPPVLDSALPPVMDVLPVATNVALLDLSITVQITHTFQGDLDMDLSSPIGTNVVLATDVGGSLDDVNVTFADFGIPITPTTDLNQGQVVTPEGPGTMADFQCENSAGDWIFTVDDDAGGDVGTLDQWCLNIYEEPQPGLNCCPRPTGFVCSNAGACGGPAVLLSWSNNSGYNALEIVRTAPTGVMTIALGAGDTSYTDTMVAPGESYGYTLRFQCAPGGLLQDSESCVANVDTTSVPGVQNLTCTPAVCGTNSVTLDWTNGAVYSSLTLQRGGLFLADVTGQTCFVDPNPGGGSGTYSLIADCGGNTTTTNCAVTLAPPPVTDLICSPDFCGNLVDLTWNDNGVTYDALTLQRGGVFLADVTGLTAFTDLMPVAGNATYSVVADCGGATAATTCAVTNALTLPNDLACSAPLGSDTVTITWTNPIFYDTIEILRDGVLVTPQPGPGDEMYLDTGLAQGLYTYTLTFSCFGGSDSLTCQVGVINSNEFLFIPRDGSNDGINLHDVNTGDFLASIVSELSSTEIFVATNAVVGPRVPGGDLVIYLADQTGQDNGSVLRYELDGTLIGEFIDDLVYDDVRAIEFVGDDLFVASAGDNVVVDYDIGNLTGTPFVTGTQATDILVHPNGSVLVSDWASDTVTLYDAAGLNPVVLVSSANSTINNPNQIAALSNGNFVVGTEGSDEIIEFTDTGTVVQSFAIGFNVQGVFQLPGGLVLFTTDAGTGIFSLDLITGTITNVYDNGTFDFYYVEHVALGPVQPTDLFVRGDCNPLAPGVSIADAIYLLGHLFPSGGPPNVLTCRDACDTNDDGSINLPDVVALLGSLFSVPAPLLPPPNTTTGCGTDPTPMDSLDCAVNTPGC